MTETTDACYSEQEAMIAELARQGCSLNEVGTALGFNDVQISQILENDEHPLCKCYWQAKIEYTQRLRSVALNIAENSVDESVRAKMVEFLAKENQAAFEGKQLNHGFTNIRKLLSLVRAQFAEKKKEVPKTNPQRLFRGSRRASIRNKKAKEASNGRKK